ncbi:MAG: triphosphoribosyl-dephospho-CoA synthase [Rhodocyclaceae bacterium]
MRRPVSGFHGDVIALAELVDVLARDALRRELVLEGKPGLVTPSSCGSHRDMDFACFERSIAALRGYFGDCVLLGARACELGALQARGLDAEGAMFRATGGVNTHKGAVFTLGLLSAAVGAQQARGRIHIPSLGDVVAQIWGEAILRSGRDAALAQAGTHGLRLRIDHGLPGAREQAAAGFPVLFEVTLPTLRAARSISARWGARAALQALFATMAVLPDTNLAHRGGLEGLAWARAQATDFLVAGGLAATDAAARIAHMEVAFVARWLSPGGSADLLATAFWLDALEQGMETGVDNALRDAGVLEEVEA